MSHSAGWSAADDLLRKLLARIERQSDRVNRVGEKMPTKSWMSDDRSDLYGRLQEAAAAGCVELEWGKRENRHNLDRIILLDTDRLYAFLGTKSPGQIAEAARTALTLALPSLHEEFLPALDSVIVGWSQSRNVIRGVEPDDILDAARTFQAAYALVEGGWEGTGYRTFSRRATGDSKFLESSYGKVADLIRMVRKFEDHFDSLAVIESYGLKRIPSACLLSGPITYQGWALPTKPYIGLPPEMVTEIGIAGPVKWVLLIENLESFNRQVREANMTDGIIVYTGGFPSASTLMAILRLARTTDCPICHWGDIDAGGVKIAHRIDHALSDTGKTLRLHLMSPEIARQRGKPGPSERIFKEIVPSSVDIRALADFLASDQACYLEQEELDPVLPLLSASPPSHLTTP